MHKLRNQTASVFKLPTEQRRPATKDFQPVQQQETKKETFSNLSFYQMKNQDKASKLLSQVFSIAERWEDQMEEDNLAELLGCLDQAMLVIHCSGK